MTEKLLDAIQDDLEKIMETDLGFAEDVDFLPSGDPVLAFPLRGVRGAVLDVSPIPLGSAPIQVDRKEIYVHLRALPKYPNPTRQPGGDQFRIRGEILDILTVMDDGYGLLTIALGRRSFPRGLPPEVSP